MIPDAYAVIGDPIDHSLSPTIHNAAFRYLGMNCTYLAYRIPRDELAAGVESLLRSHIRGFNVTIPHKTDIIHLLDDTDKSARMAGAVNTVKITDSSMIGYNTDIDGFVTPLCRRIDVQDTRALILGAGGAARAAVVGLAAAGVSHIMICARTIQNARALADLPDDISTEYGYMPDKIDTGYDIVVNATPLGMGGAGMPADITDITPDSVVYDMVYRPVTTPFLKAASDAGCRIVRGWEMLLEQAVLAFEIWHDTKAPYDTMKRALLGGFA